MHAAQRRPFAAHQQPAAHRPALRRLALVISIWLAALAPLVTEGQTPPPDYRGEPAIEPLSSFPQGVLSIEAGKRSVRFNIWLADTPRRQQQGLMFVRDLPADQGMLFVNDPPRPASFWMKNTYIPLDLLFIDARGRIVQIFEHATPMSLRPIAVSTPVRAVLELRGGESARQGIQRGARVVHSAFEN